MRGERTTLDRHTLATMPCRVSGWCRPFAGENLAELATIRIPGRHRQHGPPGWSPHPGGAGYARGTAPLLAPETGDVRERFVLHILRDQKMDLSGRQSGAIEPTLGLAVSARAPFHQSSQATVAGLYPLRIFAICTRDTGDDLETYSQL